MKNKDEQPVLVRFHDVDMEDDYTYVLCQSRCSADTYVSDMIFSHKNKAWTIELIPVTLGETEYRSVVWEVDEAYTCDDQMKCVRNISKEIDK